jgi:hypothetical protein
VRRDGLVQAVDVPSGRGIVTWSYRPPGFRMGFALSLGATSLILLAVNSALFVSASRRRRERAAAIWEPSPAETAVSQARALSGRNP